MSRPQSAGGPAPATPGAGPAAPVTPAPPAPISRPRDPWANWKAGERDRGTLRAGPAIALAVVILILFGFLKFGYFYFNELAQGQDVRALPVLINEMTGTASGIFVFFMMIPFVRRFPITRRPAELRTRIPLHLLALVAASAFMTTFMWLSRSVLYPLAGLEGYDYGIMLLRYPMEAFNHVTNYLIFVGAIQVWSMYEEAREREIAAAKLEARLSDARLQSLQAQLHPHFLFNTLNTISSVMYRSPEDADRVLSLLSDLLRLQLAAPDAQLVSVEEEMEALRIYLQIMEARFPDRLRWNVHVGHHARGAEVPSFLLQPLVENAIRHGVSRRADAGRIDVEVERDGDRLVITVEDDGPGPGASPEGGGSGVGISNTTERLRHLYGAAGTFRLESRVPRGARAVVEIPFRAALARGTEPR